VSSIRVQYKVVFTPKLNSQDKYRTTYAFISWQKMNRTSNNSTKRSSNSSRINNKTQVHCYGGYDNSCRTHVVFRKGSPLNLSSIHSRHTDRLPPRPNNMHSLLISIHPLRQLRNRNVSYARQPLSTRSSRYLVQLHSPCVAQSTAVLERAARVFGRLAARAPARSVGCSYWMTTANGRRCLFPSSAVVESPRPAG
jgi:hypothetical protein